VVVPISGAKTSDKDQVGESHQKVAEKSSLIDRPLKI